MNTFKIYFILLLCLFIFLSGLANQIHSQIFLRGIYGLMEPGDLLTNNNEQQLIDNTNTNHISGCILHQDVLEQFCRTLCSGNIRMNVEQDMISGLSYHCDDPGRYNYYVDCLWPYICRSSAANIQSTEIDRFINNTYTHYSPDFIGIETIMVAHQGHTDDATHWSFIDYAGAQIQTRFGDSVRSLAITEVATSKLDPADLPAFVAAVPHLDIFMYECYPLRWEFG